MDPLQNKHPDPPQRFKKNPPAKRCKAGTKETSNKNVAWNAKLVSEHSSPLKNVPSIVQQKSCVGLPRRVL